MKRAALWLAAGFCVLAARGAEHDFPRPDRVRYDGQCFTIDGQDTFLFGGSFHYFRCPPELWRERFRQLKEAGVNVVTTVVPWNLYERTPPASAAADATLDFSDLRAWLRMAHDEFGFYTIVRPGPYMCAEWDGGGFPRWLLARRPAGAAGRWLRTADPSFLAWSRHWYRAVCAAIAPEQVTRRAPGTGGIILMQLENEYDLDEGISPATRAAALRALYRDARQAGIEVPLFTCWTRECRDSDDPELGRVFDAINAYPRYRIQQTADDLAALESAQPDAPAMVSELQGGWFSTVGGTLSADQPGLTPAQLQAHFLLALQCGATAINTYMAVGGTNFGRWAARGQTTTYDYDAPVREWGAGGAKFRVFAALGRMLRQYGPALARARPAPWPVQSGSPDVVVGIRVERSGAVWIFFGNRSLTERRRGRAVVWSEKAGELGINYDLGPFEAKALRLPPTSADASDGEWFPQLEAPAGSPASPAPIPLQFAPIPPQVGGAHADILMAAPPGKLLPELGVFDARPVIYTAEPVLTAAQAAASVLRAQVYSDDRIVAQINGRVIAGESNPSGSDSLPIAGLLRPGRNSIRLLYYQKGEPNFGPGIEDEPGLRAAFVGDVPLTDLTIRPVDLPSWRGDPAAAGLVAGYRADFNLEKAARPTPLNLRLDASGDGELFLNGHPLGRYWEAGPQRRYYLPACWLRAGSNSVAVYLVRGPAGPAGIAAASVESYPISSAGSQ